MKPFQLLTEIRFARLQIAHGSNHDGVAGALVKNPLVVLKPRTAFHLDRAYNTQCLGNLTVSLRQSAPIEHRVVLRRPGNALWTRRVEEMNMSIDDRHGRGPPSHSADCHAAKKCSPVHGPILVPFHLSTFSTSLPLTSPP